MHTNLLTLELELVLKLNVDAQEKGIEISRLTLPNSGYSTGGGYSLRVADNLKSVKPEFQKIPYSRIKNAVL